MMAISTKPSFMGGGMAGAINKQKASSFSPMKRRPPTSGGSNAPVFGGATTPGNEGMNDTRVHDMRYRGPGMGGGGWRSQVPGGGFTGAGFGGGMRMPYASQGTPVMDFGMSPVSTVAQQAAGRVKGMPGGKIPGAGGGINTAPSGMGASGPGDSGYGPLLGGMAMLGGNYFPMGAGGNLGNVYKNLMLQGVDVMNPNSFADTSMLPGAIRPNFG